MIVMGLPLQYPITTPTYLPTFTTTSCFDMAGSTLDHPCFTNNSHFDSHTASSTQSNDTGTFFHLPTDLAIVQRKRIGTQVRIRKPKKRKPKRPFVRRKLPYHLVMRCLRRRANRPPRLVGPSRRDQLRTRREKRRRYRRGRVAREHTAFYEHLLNQTTQPQFQLDEFDKDLLSLFVGDLDPTQPFRLCREFNLESPSISFQDSIAALVSRHHDVCCQAAYPS